MLVSILHRSTGIVLATAGAALLTSWLVAAASGAEAYQAFQDWMAQPVVHILLAIVGVGLTWSFFQHMFSGLRHFVLDTGSGYDLRTNKLWATMTIVGSVTMTVAVWAWLLRGAF